MTNSTHMKYLISIFISLVVSIGFCQEGTTSFIGIGTKLQLDTVSIPHTSAAKILEFTPDGAALNSGLKVGDLITKVDGKSAINIPLTDVIKLIVGEEGTNVTIEVKRNGVVKSFVLTRKKIANAVTVKPVASSEFCNQIAAILNDAPYHFNHIVDSTLQLGDGHPCKLKVTGAERIVIETFLTATCHISFGNYATEDEINVAGEKLISQLQTCFPEYYYSPFFDGDKKSVQIGMTIPANGGYYQANMELQSVMDKTTNRYGLELIVYEGVPRKFFNITAESTGSEFAKAIRKVYDQINSDFSSIRGEQHTSGSVFNASYWYGLNFTIPAAANAYIDDGAMTSMVPNQCIAHFFLGSKEDAAETYTKFSQIVYDALGSEFVYSYDRPKDLIEQVLPDATENLMMFAIKRERCGENIPVIALVNQKQADGRYLIYMDFYKTMY